MDIELFENPVEKLIYNIRTEEPNALNKFLQLQKSNFTDAKRFITLKSKSSDSQNIRNELNQKKSFPYKSDVVNAAPDFLSIVYKFSDRFNIDEYLSCKILYHTYEHSSTRNEFELIEFSEKYILDNRSCYLQFLREILFTLQDQVDSKLKYDILQQFVGELISEQSNEKNILNILIKTLEEKVSSMNVSSNPLECSYRVKECIQIVETLFLISVQFTIKEDIIKSIIKALNLCIEKQIDDILKNSLFEITFLLYFTVFSIFDGVKNATMYNPIEKCLTHNQIEHPNEIENEIQQIKSTHSIKSSLFLIFYLIFKDIKGENINNYVFNNSDICNKLPFEGDAYKFLLQVVQTKEFQVSDLNLFLCSYINILSCKYITFLPSKNSINNLNSDYINNFNLVLSNIFDNSSISSIEFWRRGEETMYFLNYLWFQTPDSILISSFRLMGSLARSNTNEVFNFFVQNSQYSWYKLFQTFINYAKDLNDPNLKLEEIDAKALSNMFLLIARLVESSVQVSTVFTKFGQILNLAFQFSVYQINIELRTSALRLITAFSKYSLYFDDIWRSLNETSLLKSGLDAKSPDFKIEFTQQSLELLLTLLENHSIYLFGDSNNQLKLRNYLDQCIELFNLVNTKSFNCLDDKWKFLLSIIKVFEFCLKQFNQTIQNCQIDKSSPVYILYLELNKSGSSKTLEGIIKIIDYANDQSGHIQQQLQQQQELQYLQMNQQNLSPQQQQYQQYQQQQQQQNYLLSQLLTLQQQKQHDKEVFSKLLIKCLDLLLLISDSTIYGLEEAKSLVFNLSNMNRSKPIISIAKLVDNEIPKVSFRALRLIFSFETFTHQISTVFLENDPDDIINRFIKMMEFNEMEFEDFSGSYYNQYLSFQKYSATSIQWMISQLILSCIQESQPNTYSLGHFLLGCYSNVDLSKDFHKKSRTCLTIILRQVQNPQFVERYPHLVECYHNIIHRMIKDPVTYKPMLKFINEEYPNYFKLSMEVLTNSIAINSYSYNGRTEALVSSLSWVLKSCSISIQNVFSLDMKQFLSNYIFPAMNIHSTMMIMSSINVLTLYNTIEFQLPEITTPRLFSIYPELVPDPNNLTNSPYVLQNHNGVNFINIKMVKQLLDSTTNTTSATGATTTNTASTTSEGGANNTSTDNIKNERDLEECCITNLSLLLYNAKIRALDGWKSFVNVSLCQNTIEIDILDESLLLSLLQRIVLDFSNERNPIESNLSIGNTITTILSVLKRKKQNYQLFSQTMSIGENNIIEQKMKSILEGLLQTVLKSPHHIIRGLSYICLIQYLDLTEQQQTSDQNVRNQELINDLNLNLVSKIEDKFIRILSSDCNSFSRGWRIAALSCLQSILSIDNLRGHRTLLYLQNKGFIINMISFTTMNFLSDKWEFVESKDLHVYRSQMSLLLKISQQMDGVHILMNNNVIGSFTNSPFLNYIPTDKVADKFYDMFLPILKLFASLCLYNGNNSSNPSSHHSDRNEIYKEIFNFILNHSDLFILILSDNNIQFSFKNLEILKLTCYLFSKVSSLFSKNHQHPSELQFHKFHHSLINLLIKYSTNSKKIIENTRPENYDEELLASKIDFSYSAGKQHEYPNSVINKKNQFQILVKQMICSINHDLLMYCRKVFILSDQRLGFDCFDSKLNIMKQKSSEQQHQQTQSKPSLDLAIGCLIDNIIQYSFYKMDSNQCQKLLDSYDQLTHGQYQEILQSDEAFTPAQRNHMVLNILKQKIRDIETQISIIFENIEILLVLIVTHAYYFSNQLNILFQSNQQLFIQSSTSPLQQSQLLKNTNSNNFNLSDLNNSTIKPTSTTTMNKNNDSVFLQSKSSNQQNGMLSSVFNSIFKGNQNVPSSKITTIQSSNLSNQQQQQQQQQQPLQQSHLLNSIRIQSPNQNVVQFEQSKLSNQDIEIFLKRLKQSFFDREINQLNIKLSDAIFRLDKKSTIIDLMLKKLQDLTK